MNKNLKNILTRPLIKTCSLGPLTRSCNDEEED